MTGEQLSGVTGLMIGVVLLIFNRPLTDWQHRLLRLPAAGYWLVRVSGIWAGAILAGFGLVAALGLARDGLAAAPAGVGCASFPSILLLVGGGSAIAGYAAVVWWHWTRELDDRLSAILAHLLAATLLTTTLVLWVAPCTDWLIAPTSIILASVSFFVTSLIRPSHGGAR